MPFLLKTLSAQHRPPLGRTKRYRRLLAALGTVGPGLGFHVGLPVGGSQHCYPFPLTVLATFGFVLELLVVEEQLFTGSKNEVRATIHALQ